MQLPVMTRIRVRFPREKVDDVGRALQVELASSGVRIRAGARIAIAVGSRGIAELATMVRTTVAWVRAQGGQPFIVPAMGSHGGATAEGQQAVLAGYRVTEGVVGAPICSSMDVVEVPQGESPVPVFFDKQASAADGTIVLNRVKPHTSFHGRYESGLMKMMAIGLGKQRQALAIHARGVAGLRDISPLVARQVLQHGNVILGIGVVENACDEVLRIRAVPAARIPDEEPALLELARANMPRLPVERLDLLIVDEIGKNISGLGMDTNIIGRLKIQGQPEPDRPSIRVIVARDLTPETQGNAAGVGLADIITRRLYEKIDLQATCANVLTTGFLERAKIPMIAETDRQAVAMAFRAWGMDTPDAARIIRIRNTLHLDYLHVSPAVLRELEGQGHIEVLGPAPQAFAAGDTLPEFG
jgi:hypothetical protein